MTRPEQHDLPTVAIQLSGAPGGPELDPLSTDELVARYCDPARHALEDGAEIDAGFCGFTGAQGYDDGYAFMGDLGGRKWRVLADVGDWPYSVWVTRPPHPGEARWTIAHYCEGDLVVYRFATLDDAARFRATLDPAP